MRVASYVILVLVLLAGRTYAAQRCKDYEYIAAKINQIENDSKTLDVSDDIDSLRLTIKISCPENDSPALLERIESFESVGIKNHHEFLKNEVEYISKFREPKKEIEEIRDYEKRMEDEGIDFEEKLSERDEVRFMSLGRNSARKGKESCSNIDNRRPPFLNNSEEYAHKNHMRNQDSLGWCFAFAAADLLSYELGLEVSAIDIANAHNDGKFSKTFLGKPDSEVVEGYDEEAIEAALERGLCLEEDVRSDDYQFSKLFHDLKKELVATEELYRAYNERTSNRGLLWGRTKKTGRELDHAVSDFSVGLRCGEFGSEWEEVFPGLEFDELMKALTQANSENSFIDNLIEKSCKPRLKVGVDIPKLKVKTLSPSFFTKKSELMDQVDQELEEDNIALIDYMSDVLHDRHKSDDGAHTSSIVARKLNESTGSCEYLVRNSYGTGCTGYDPEFECEEGNIWVPREYLERSTLSVTYVE